MECCAAPYVVYSIFQLSTCYAQSRSSGLLKRRGGKQGRAGFQQQHLTKICAKLQSAGFSDNEFR